MRARTNHRLALICAVMGLLSLVAGCSVFHRDATGTAENQALTQQRQQKIQQHKDQ